MVAAVPSVDEVDERRKTPDRRVSSRRRTLKSGWTFWANGDSSECIVCNLSEMGAQLELRGPVPNLFDLVIDGDASRRPCVVIWRKAKRVGVKFEGASAVSTRTPTRQLRRLRDYAEECRRLADQAGPSDRAILSEMAEAWIKVMRRLNRGPC
jgi:hypothetical protein